MAISVWPIIQAILCGTLSPAVKSVAGSFWSLVVFLWPWHWLWILIGLVAWTIFEIITRNGSWHYNSKNGFSPAYNVLVGSGTYLLLQTLVYFILQGAFGDGVYCQPWAYLVHILVFIFTGGLLNLTGFWVYWKLPF